MGSGPPATTGSTRVRKRRDAAERRRSEERERRRAEALRELGVDAGERKEEAKQKRPSRLEAIYKEKEEERREREQMRQRWEQEREGKQRERKRWQEKFKKRTGKGQIPLDHRINYVLKKIKKSRVQSSRGTE